MYTGKTGGGGRGRASSLPLSPSSLPSFLFLREFFSRSLLSEPLEQAIIHADGRPDSLYFLPELYRGSCNLSLSVPFCEKDYVHFHVVETEKDNEYKGYFLYLVQTCNLPKPKSWRDGLQLYVCLQQYHTILSYAKD